MIKNNIYKIDKTADGLAKPYLQITFKMTLEEWTSDYNSRLVSENVKCLFLILTLDTQAVSSAGRERVKLMVKNFSSCTLMLCWWLPTLLSQPGVAYIVREKCNNDWAVRLWSPGEPGQWWWDKSERHWYQSSLLWCSNLWRTFDWTLDTRRARIVDRDPLSYYSDQTLMMIMM